MLGLLLNKWVWIAVIIGGLMVALFVQNIRVKNLKADVEMLTTQKEILVAANEVSTVTIGEMTKEKDRLTKSYEVRLTMKENAVKEAIKICNLKAVKPGGKNEGSSDPVLIELNQLFPAGN